MLLFSRTRSPRRQVSSSAIATVLDATENGLVLCHGATGLPWWSCIVGVTAALRLCLTLPLSIHQQRVLARLESIRPTLLEWRTALEHKHAVKARRADQPPEQAQAALQAEFTAVRTALFREHKCAPWRAALPIYMHVPIWIDLSFGLRQLYANANESAALASQGFLWIGDLAAPDSTMALPLLLGASGLLTLEVHALRARAGGVAPSQTQTLLTRAFRTLCVVMVPVSSQVPAGLCLFWVTSSLLGLLQALALRYPRLRRACGIIPTPSESRKPVRDLLKSMLVRTQEFGRDVVEKNK